MKKLKDRWLTEIGDALYNAVLKCISENGDLAQIPGLGRFEGRLDLRGIVLPINLSIPHHLQFAMKNFSLRNTDLSYSTLYGSIWQKCELIDVVFKSAKTDHSKFIACRFDNVLFEKTYLNEAVINASLDGDTGYLRNTTFIECNMKGSTYDNTLFDKCRFQDCNLDLVDFNGSRFMDCKFQGRLNEVFFRGWPLINRKLYPSARPIPNEMLRVDFSEAILESVMFLDSIDLSSCTFPDSDDYIIIRNNRRKLFEYVRKEIDSHWEGVAKKIGLILIDQSYLSARQIDKEVEIVDRHFLLKTNKDFGLRFFELIRKVDSQLNANRQN